MASEALRPPLLEARNITVRFGGLVAVDDVSLSFRRAELVGIIGPNGAGKTTFFNAISGVIAPTSGQLIAAGRNLAGKPTQKNGFAVNWHNWAIQ